MADFNKLSIVTPVLNGELFIERLFNSILCQRYNKQVLQLEHIIVDGGSTDRTSELVQRYMREAVNTDLDIQYILGKDRNHVDALNLGILSSTGTIIGIANADDHYSHDAFEKLIRCLGRCNKHNLFVYGNCFVENGVSSYVFDKRFTLVNCLLGRHPINPISYFYSKELHNTVSFYNEMYQLVHDLDFLIRIRRVACCIRINSILGTFYKHPASKTVLSSADHTGLAEVALVTASHMRHLTRFEHCYFSIFRLVLNFWLKLKMIAIKTYSSSPKTY